MKKIVLLLAVVLAPISALAAGEYDGVWYCGINLGSYGTREAYFTFQTKPDNSALLLTSAPVNNTKPSYGYAIGTISGNTFNGVGNDLSPTVWTFSGNSLTLTDTYTVSTSSGNVKIPASYSCSKIW